MLAQEAISVPAGGRGGQLWVGEEARRFGCNCTARGSQRRCTQVSASAPTRKRAVDGVAGQVVRGAAQRVVQLQAGREAWGSWSVGARCRQWAASCGNALRLRQCAPQSHTTHVPAGSCCTAA